MLQHTCWNIVFHICHFYTRNQLNILHIVFHNSANPKGTIVTKVNKVPEEQSRNTGQLTKGVLDDVLIHMVVPFEFSGNAKSKPNVDHVSETTIEVSKIQDVYAENFNKTLESMHACDEPPSKYDIGKLFNNPVSEHVSELVVDTFIDVILHSYHEETKDSSDEENVASQVNDVVKNEADIPNEEVEISKYPSHTTNVVSDDEEHVDDGHHDEDEKENDEEVPSEEGV